MQKNNFLNKFTSVLIGGALALSSSASAQTLLWGAGSSDTRIDSIGRFASSDGTLTSLGWTLTGVSNPNALWKWRAGGTISGPNFSAGRAAISSASAADGYACFHADSLGWSTPPISPAPQDALMTSPVINLTGYTDSLLIVRFDCHYYDFTTPPSINEVQFSVDNGATWSTFEVKNITGITGTRAEYNDIVEVPLIGATNGVTNLSQCLVRFRAGGDPYFWLVDDVSIITGQAFTDGGFGAEDFTTVKISNNYSTPLSQIAAQEFFFGAGYTNRGTNTILAADSARVNVTIAQDISGTWTTVHTQSLFILDTIANGEEAFNVANLTWTPTTTGNFRATYTLSIRNDNNPTNDTSVQFFRVTDNYFSKVALNSNFHPTFSTTIYPAGDTVVGFEWGSMFYVPSGRTPNRLALDTVSYQAFVPTSTSSSLSAVPVTVRVYKYRDNNNDGILNDVWPSTELQLVGLSIDSVPVTSTTRGTMVFRKTPIFDVNDPDSQLILLDTSIYFITLDQNRALGLATGPASSTTFFGVVYGGSESEDYNLNALSAANNFVSSRVLPSPLRRANRNGAVTQRLNWIGFGGDVVPSIGFTINAPRVVPISVNETQAAAYNMSIFPNPNKGILNLNIDLGENTPNVLYTITDAAGRVVQSTVRNNIQAEVYTFNVESLPAGVYYLSVQTKKGTSTQSFIKQ